MDPAIVDSLRERMHRAWARRGVPPQQFLAEERETAARLMVWSAAMAEAGKGMLAAVEALELELSEQPGKQTVCGRGR
jgi:hypothetical protein